MFTQRLKYFDWVFFSAIMLLTLVGLMMIYSTGFSGTTERILWQKQLVYAGLGISGLFFFASLDYRFLSKTGSLTYVAGLLLLLLVLFIGPEIRNSRRWLDLGLINFQPAEFIKLGLILLLAKYFQGKQGTLSKFRHVIWSSVYVVVPAVLVMLQPDLGSAGVLVMIWLGMLFVSPMPRRFFIYLLLIFIVTASVSWVTVLADYQKARVVSFLDPTADAQGTGYNVIQSIVAVGSGGFFGRGLARGLQSQLRFLPERQTDFIFASTVEELGFLGGGLVLLFLVFVLLRMVKILHNAHDSFGKYLAGGIFFLILTQTVINVGMNLGLLPVTGITLPFLSYGGSSLVITLWLAGIMESLAQRSAPVRFN